MAKNEKTFLSYQVQITDGNGTVANEVIAGSSKAQVLEQNQFPHCKTQVTYDGRVRVTLEPTSEYADEATIVMQSKKTEEKHEFNESSVEDKNHIAAKVHLNGRSYLIQETSSLRNNLQKILNNYSDNKN